MLIFTNTSISFAGQFKSKWGVVISVTPISITTNYSEPYTKVFCNKRNQSRLNNFADIAVGGMIGSVIGNKLSDVHGAGSIGALFGSLIAIDNSKTHQVENCYEKTIYSNRKITKFSISVKLVSTGFVLFVFFVVIAYSGSSAASFVNDTGGPRYDVILNIIVLCIFCPLY